MGLVVDVHFADGADRHLAVAVVPLVLPAAAQLQTLLRQDRGYAVHLGVVSGVVVGLTAAPVRVLHLRHARTAVAARAAGRRVLPDERRLLVAGVVALPGGPEHLLAAVTGRVASAPR